MEENRTFEEVVRSIEMSEKDVDRILKAAKLQRHPKMSDDRFETLVIAVSTIIALGFIFGFMALTVICG